MRRLFIALFIIAALGIFSPDPPALAQPTQNPHEDPAQATGEFDGVALLLSYGDIINLAASQQYQDAEERLREMSLAEIPDELRYITGRYQELCQQLIATLDNLEYLLNEASDLLARHRIDEARPRLDGAEADIQDALLLITDIEMATDTLSGSLGVSASPIDSQIRQAHTRLETSEARLRQLIEALRGLRDELTDRYTQMTDLTPTSLSLNVTPGSVFIGDSVTASGRLEGAGEAMAGRMVLLTLDGENAASATTTGDGSYTASSAIPRVYTPTMTVTAAYEPSGDDTGKYLASQSPAVTLNTLFYPTQIEVSAPQTVHPGMPFTLSGLISSEGGSIDRTIRVSLDGTPLAEATVAGEFRLEVTPPVDASTGTHRLDVAITAQGRYAAAASALDLDISKVPLHIDVQAPGLVLLPQAIRVSGRVYDEAGPVPGALVRLSLKNVTTTLVTSADGSFSGSFRLRLIPELPSLSLNPFRFSMPATGASFQMSPFYAGELSISVEPAQPWYETPGVTSWLGTINPASAGVLLVILAAVGLVISRKSRARLPRGKAAPPAKVKEPPATTPAPEPRPILSGTGGRILFAYLDALEAVEKTTGIRMLPNTTLREFLKTATLPPPAAGEFAELTAMAEAALYATPGPPEDAAARAERLATNIKEELRRGPA